MNSRDISVSSFGRIEQIWGIYGNFYDNKVGWSRRKLLSGNEKLEEN